MTSRALLDALALILGMGDLVARSIGPSITIRTELQSQTVHAVADANQLELALLNLIINARDAMPNVSVRPWPSRF